MIKKLVLFLLICSPVFGQISLDAGSPQNSGNQAGTPYSFNLTIGGGCTNPVLFVAVGITDAGTPRTVSSISYNSVALTQIGASTSTGTNLRTDIWQLINPTHDGAAHSVTVTLSGAPVTGSSAAAWGFCGVDQVTPVDVANTANGNSTSATVAITTVTNNAWYVVVTDANTTPITVGDGATQDWNNTNQQMMAHKGPLTPAGVQNPTSAIGAGGGIWSISAAGVRPATGGSTGGTTTVGPTTKKGPTTSQ